MTCRRGLPLLLALLFAGSSARAQAQPATPPPTELPAETGEGTMARPNDGVQQAVVHYERSRGYYATGHYRAAIAELESAIHLDAEASNLYFDLGLLYERIGVIDRARMAYGRYLRLTRDAGERERTERIMRRLAGAEVELADFQRSRRAGRADAWLWVSVALAGAGLAAGVGFAVASARANDTAMRLQMTGQPMAMVEQAAGQSTAFAVGAGVSFGAAVGFGVGAALLYALRPALPQRAPVCLTDARVPGALQLHVGPAYAGALLWF